MPGHVLSLTGGAVAYESKCALKISFSSRDATDKELAGAPYLVRNILRGIYLSYLAEFPPYSLSPFPFLSLPLFFLFLSRLSLPSLSLFVSNQ